jgi:ribose transport system substrate-binding protein
MEQRRSARIPAVVAVLALAGLGVAGCGSSGSSDTGSSGASGSGGKKYDITLITGVKGDAFYGSLACGAKQAADRLGATLNVQGPDRFDPSLQTPIVNAVAAKKPDAVLIAVTDSKAMYAPLKQLASQGTKIVLVDTTLDDPSLAAAEVSSDNLAAGGLAAREVAREAGRSGSVLTVDVNPGISTTAARVNGFKAEAKTIGFTDLGVQYTGDDPAKASSVVTSTLAAHPDLAGVFATNTLTGEGAATGLRSAGKAGKVRLIGFDANPSGVEAIERGVAQAQVVLKPLDIGYQGVEQAVNALSGKPVTKKILTGSTIATRKNLNDPSVKRYLYTNSCS